MLFDEVREVVLDVVVLLNVLEEAAALFLLLHASHRELEHILSALFVVDFDLVQKILRQPSRALLSKQNDSQNFQKFHSTLCKNLERLTQKVQ